MRRSLVIAVALLAVIHAGCKTIPTAQLDNYQKAFSEVRYVSEDMLLDFDRTLRESRDFVERAQVNQVQKQQALLVPYTLAGFSKVVGHADDRDIKVRKQALDVIEKYNEALSILASGKSVKDVQSAAEGFGNALTKFVETAAGSSFPGAEAVIGLAKNIVAQIEKARLRQQFEAAVKDGAPLVDKILEELKADTNEHYEAAWVLQNRLATLVVGEIVESVTSIKRMYEANARPDEDKFESLADRAAKLNQLLKPLEPVLPADDFPYSFTSAPSAKPAQPGPPPVPATPAPPDYTTALDVAIESQVKQIVSLMTIYRSHANKMMALGEALNNYQALLEATRNGMNALRNALDSPQNLEAICDELLSLAFQIKRNMEAIRTPSTVSPY